MNKTVTSRAEILKAAKELALSKGTDALGMREVAQHCNIAVGSIYNYFPTKSDLEIAVVGEIWMEIFEPALCTVQNEGFLRLVRRMSTSVREGIAAYPDFFSQHALMIGDKQRGRTAMGNCFARLRAALLDALKGDRDIRADAWGGALTPEAFVDFVLGFIRSNLVMGQEHGELLEALIQRVAYQ